MIEVLLILILIVVTATWAENSLFIRGLRRKIRRVRSKHNAKK